MTRATRRLVIMAGLGLLADILLVGYYGVGAVGAALAAVGWLGLASVTLFHVMPLGLCAIAWRALARPAASIGDYLRFRLIREAGGILPIGGPLLGIRAMGLAGIEVDVAVATAVVDSTLEMATQLLFVLFGVNLLLLQQPGGAAAGWAVGGLTVLACLLAAFALVQRFGPFRLLASPVFERAWFPLVRAARIQDRIHRIYADRASILRASAMHLAGWLVGAGEAGLALYLLGLPLGVGAVLALESLSCGLRGAAFFVPASAGVQEGGYVVLGAIFGLGPEIALSLSLLKRARELLVTVAGLALWQAAESAGVGPGLKRAVRTCVRRIRWCRAGRASLPE